MKKILKAILFFGLLAGVTACSSQESADHKSSLTDFAEISSETEPAADPVSRELTMELLLELYENHSLSAKVESEGLDGFLLYENLKPADELNDESLTGLYSCSLTYPHTDSVHGMSENRIYEFQLYYWKPETAEEYGHEKNEIDDILLMEKETGDAVLLYNSDDQYTPVEHLKDFLEKEYGPEEYFSVSFPDGFALGNYQSDIASFSGWLLRGNTEEPVHGEAAVPGWYAPGGIGRVPNASEILQFDAGKLTGASLLMNHSNVISEAEPLDGCEVLAVLMEYEFDLFTAAEWAEYLEANPEADNTETTSHYWYLFMGKEDSPVCYVLFLNEQLFSKEDAVQMARSIHFAENAF